jgi:hypothetical protein
MKVEDISFELFFQIWADQQGWKVPEVHKRICKWLQDTETPRRVLLAWRGCGKSTILALYAVWKLWQNRSCRIMVQSADNTTALKLSRDCRDIIMRNPLTVGMLPHTRPTAESRWFVHGATDSRNPSMASYGINSSATGSRADILIADDVETPKNCNTQELRDSLRRKLNDAVHILTPGFSALYVGTPFTSQSIYEEIIHGGAPCLRIPLFKNHIRFFPANQYEYFYWPHPVGADGLYVFTGSGAFSRLLTQNVDYAFADGEIKFIKKPEGLLDIYSECEWPERFDRVDILARRQACPQVSEIDSQYELQFIQSGETALDPMLLQVYDAEPVWLEDKNYRRTQIWEAPDKWDLMLGSRKLVRGACAWDVASGSRGHDKSVVSVIYFDANLNAYWHSCIILYGDLEVRNESGKLVGGQVYEALKIAYESGIGNLIVESSGLGVFVPSVARAEAKAWPGVTVTEVKPTKSKADRILGALQPLLMSKHLYCSRKVFDTVHEEMTDFNPDFINSRHDDMIDSVSTAILETPVQCTKPQGLAPEPGAESHALSSRPRSVVNTFGQGYR